MIEVAPKLFVTSRGEFKKGAPPGSLFISAARDPDHREAVGYKGRGCPKDHCEYLFAYRDGNLILNIVDADDPAYIPKMMVDEAVMFARQTLELGRHRLIIYCNQGKSRSPVLALLTIAPHLSEDFLTAEEVFSNKIYPPYMPAKGVRGFAMKHWTEYHGR
jgi:hypothetical protein